MILFFMVVWLNGNAFSKPETGKAFPSVPDSISAADTVSTQANLFFSTAHTIRQIGLNLRPEYIIPTNSFLQGENATGQPIRGALSAHLRYSFQFHPFSSPGYLYSGAYQGVGLAYWRFQDAGQLGSPVALYLFQGAQIGAISSRLSLNYEWNFGLSYGWKPYDYDTNPYNHVIGSKINAYLDVNFYLKWLLTPQFDLISGVSLAHFSNGNTRFPNAGLNTAGINVGLSYHLNSGKTVFPTSVYLPTIPAFPKHVSYDLILFGAWRRKGVVLGESAIASPHVYPVAGFSFAPMYNFGYRVRAGVSLDGFYDGSANIYTEDYIVPYGGGQGSGYTFYNPPLSKQLALGLAGRGEYVMPYFTVALGFGVNVLHGGGDMKGFYQTLALKMELTKDAFLHIGYSLKDFHEPNFLMLGVGYRFNNRYPCVHR